MEITKDCPKNCRYIYGGDWCICNTECPKLPHHLIKCPQCGALVKVDTRRPLPESCHPWTCPKCGNTGVTDIDPCRIFYQCKKYYYQTENAALGRQYANYRGKRVDDGTWAYGYYALFASNKGLVPAIYTVDDNGALIAREVVPETVTQSTMLLDKDGLDKDGKEIYEGDIIVFNKGFSNESFPYLIRYNPRRCAYEEYEFGRDSSLRDGYRIERDVMDVCTLVGNFWDNPELLDTEKWIREHTKPVSESKKKKKTEKVEQESFL